MNERDEKITQLYKQAETFAECEIECSRCKKYLPLAIVHLSVIGCYCEMCLEEMSQAELDAIVKANECYRQKMATDAIEQFNREKGA